MRMVILDGEEWNVTRIIIRTEIMEMLNEKDRSLSEIKSCVFRLIHIF